MAGREESGSQPYSQLYVETEEAAYEAMRHQSIGAGLDIISQNSPYFDFSANIHYDLARRFAWDPKVGIEAPLYLLSLLPKVPEWTKGIANLGKYLGEDDDFSERSHAVLDLAAERFEEVYTAMDGQPWDEKSEVLLADYVRVAALQDEAGDKEGATRTAIKLASHLIRLVAEAPADGGDYDLDDSLRSVTRHIGTLEHPDAWQLFTLIEKPAHKNLLARVLVEEHAAKLLAAGDVDGCVEMFKATNKNPLIIWGRVNELWQDGQQDTVHRFIKAVEDRFPRYFTENDIVEAGYTPLVPVLEAAGRDDLILDIFRSLAMDGSELAPIHQFAFNCGYDNKVQRLDAMLRQIDILSYDQLAYVYKMYAAGIEKARNDAAEAAAV